MLGLFVTSGRLVEDSDISQYRPNTLIDNVAVYTEWLLQHGAHPSPGTTLLCLTANPCSRYATYGDTFWQG